MYVVGGGKVQRVALFGNDGANFDKPPSVQDVAARWAEITDLSGAKIAGFKL
ncbi:short chain dehydrogenase/reductase oxidoreductase [Mycobacterium tuberculosis]|nr:short chain dehydrogenase/reductase oxidoreductase [Mycobacterium tuberculosis]